MSDNDDLLELEEIDPVNVTPETPVQADTDISQALGDEPGLSESSEADPSEGLDRAPPDLSDVDEEFDDGLGPPSPGEMAKRIEQMTRMQVFDYVLRLGAVYFEDGHELISCPACDHDAVCALRPTKHELTGTDILVCTGPLTEAKRKFRLFGSSSTYFEAGKVKSGCTHHPDKRQKLPEGLKELRETQQEIDRKLREEYGR